MGFSLCGIPVGRGYVKTLRIFGVEDSTWPGRVVDSIPTAPTSLLILYKGLAKSARQQKAAIRAKSVGQWQMRLAVRMASRRINPCRSGQTVNLLDTQIGLVEAEECMAIIPSFGLPACRSRKVAMSELVDPTVNLYEISSREKKMSEDAAEFSAFLKRYISRWAGEAGALYLVNLVTRDSTINAR